MKPIKFLILGALFLFPCTHATKKTGFLTKEQSFLSSQDRLTSSAILRIKNGESSADDRFCATKFVRSRAHLLEKAINKLSQLTVEQIWIYCEKDFDVDLLRKKVRSCARQLLELIGAEIDRCKPLASVYPYKDQINKMRLQRAELELAETDTPEYIAGIFKKKIYNKELLDQATQKLKKAFKEYAAAQPQGGQALAKALRALTRATLILKMAANPVRTFSQKTKSQMERIVASAQKIFTMLDAKV